MMRRLSVPPFLKNFLVVLQGSALAQLIGFLILPILSRLYTPAMFGVFQSAISLLTVGLAAASLRYEIPILMAPRGSTLRGLFSLNVFLNGITAIVVAICCVAEGIFFPVRTTGLLSLLVVAPVWYLAAGLSQTFSYGVLRDHAFGRAALARIGQASAYAVVGVICGVLATGTLGLVLADASGRIVSAAILFVQSRTHLALRLTRHNLHKMRSVASRFRNFPRVSLVSATVNVTGGVVTPLLMLMSFNTTTIGQYALVDRCMGAVVAMVGQALSQVFMATLARSLRENEGNPSQIFRKIVKVQLAIGIIPCLAGMLLLPRLFPLLFGSQWEAAGIYGAILMPFYLVGFVVTPVNMALTIMEKQRWQLGWDTFRLAGVVIVWVSAAWFRWTPSVALAVYGAFGIVAYSSYLVIADRLLLLRAANDVPRYIQEESTNI